ncbi:cell division protein SepF [Candidatus Micrarchaeota archaeon]|nr:cell division protein SepF [Candidatus Micrarchaeota archaeon]MBI5176662.1 cell division protein SepF [Candidatus Micrarchaeota archaeon]
MGIFQGLGKTLGISRELNIDEFMTAAEAERVDVMHAEADAYVKPIALQNDSDLKLVQDELVAKNIVLLNISAYARNPDKLRGAVATLRGYVNTNGGDIARIDEDKILLTPKQVKIVKARKK